MAVNQEYKEYRVNDLPSTGYAGDRYYLNVGGDKFQTYIISDALTPVREAGQEFIECDTVDDLRSLDSRQIWAIQNGYYKGVTLNGYYTEGDTPAPIQYYLSDTTEEDDGGAVFEVGGIKLEHDFVDRIDVRYFGAKCNGIDDDYNPIINAINKGDKIDLYNNHLVGSLINITKNIDIDMKGANILSTSQDGFIYARGIQTKALKLASAYTKGDYTINVEDTSDIRVGQLVNIISPELYNDTRSYYYKGGIFKIDKVENNQLSISETMPFDIDDLDTDVFIYEPIKVNIYNGGTISGNITIDDAAPPIGYGVRYYYTIDSRFDNIDLIENFKIIFQINTCYNTFTHNISTGYSERPGETYDGYGIAMYSSNRFNISNVHTHSGQHGITTGGRGVNHNLYIANSIIKSEIWGLGLGYHSNTYNSEIVNSTIEGFIIAGNAVIRNCIFTQGWVEPGRSGGMILDRNKNPEFSSYVFKDCIFRTDRELTPGRGSQVPELSEDKVGYVEFDNCSNFYLNADFKNYYPDREFIWDNIKIVNCHEGFSVYIFDEVKNLTIENSTLRRRPTQNYAVDVQPSGSIENVKIRDCQIPRDASLHGPIILRIRESKSVTLDNIKTLPITEDLNTYFLDITDVENVYVNNCNLYSSNRPFNINSNSRLVIRDSYILFEANTRYLDVIRNNDIEITNSFFDILNNTAQTGYKNIKTINGDKYMYEYLPNGLVNSFVLNGSNWDILSANATPIALGLVNQSASVGNITTPDATDEQTTMDLVNELKGKINEMLSSDRASGQRAT